MLGRRRGTATGSGRLKALHGIEDQAAAWSGLGMTMRLRLVCGLLQRRVSREVGVQHPGQQLDGPPADAQVDGDVAEADMARKGTPRGCLLPSTASPSPESRSA